MQLPDGTVAEVTDLKLEGDTITATITIAWPKGPKAQGYVSFTPTMAVQAGSLVAPGIASDKQGLPGPLDVKP